MQTDVRDWAVGERGVNGQGEIVTVIEIVGSRYLKCTPDSYGRKVYIPSHGEINKLSN